MKATKSQLVDYIYHNFRKGGKKIPKKELINLPETTLRDVVEKNNCEAALEAWINRPKMIKFMVDGLKDGKEASWDCEHPSAEECKRAFEEEGIVVTKIVTAKNHHRCRYCMSIADGTNKDLLCEECKQLFNHTYYSEL